MAQHQTSPDSWIATHLAVPQKKFTEFAERVYGGTALDRKTKELVAVAASSVGRCPHCTEGHIATAKDVGASEAEIAEALAVASVQGGGTQIFWMKEDFDDFLGEGWRESYIEEADRQFWYFKREVYRDGALPEKTKHLIAIVASSALRCRNCTRAHLKRALETGNTKEEIAEALGVLWVIGSEVQLMWDEEDFEMHLGEGSAAAAN